MNFSRARVALTLSYTIPRDILPVELEMCRVHIGHARTLLLGSLIAQEHGCPFHVRMDGARRDVPDRGGPILDTMQCLCWLEIPFDWCYWLPERLPAREAIARHVDLARFDDMVWTFGEETGALIAALDDALFHHPSLIVRGTEFTPAGVSHAIGPGGHSHLLKAEQVAYAMLGREQHLATVPMVLIDQQKMSKSSTEYLHWSMLRQVPPEVAKAFLVATAMRPDDPLSVLGQPFSIEAIGLEPYTWNWSHWAELTRRGG